MADINMTSSYDGRGNVTLYGASATSDGNGVVTMSLNGDRPEAIAVAHVTLILQTEVDTSRRYYLLRSSVLEKPDRPTTNPPVSPWTETEPTYTAGSNDCLYFVDLTVFTDGSFSYSEVSLSSSYEAAKDASKTATNYMYFDSTNGLQVGNKETGSWSGYRTQMKSDSFNILDSSSNVLSSYGASQIVLGKTNSNNALINTSGVAFRNGSTELGSFTPNQVVLGKTGSGHKNVLLNQNGMAIRNGADTLALFEANNILLGANRVDSTINLCQDSGTIQAYGTDSSQGIHIFGGSNNAPSLALNDQGAFLWGVNAGGYYSSSEIGCYSNGQGVTLYSNERVNVKVNELRSAPDNPASIELEAYGGGDIVFRVGSNESSRSEWSPYHRDGETLTVADCRTAGFVTNSSKDIYFMVPLTKPVISGTTANVTVSVTSVTLQLRQNGNYTHGTSSAIAPSSATAMYVPGVGIHVKCTMAATTNAVNNAPVGVDFDGTFTF